MRPGQHRKQVTLSRGPQTPGDSDGYDEPLTPALWWLSLSPLPSLGDGRTTFFLAVGRYHPQVTMDVQILYHDPAQARDRKFFVRSMENVNEQNQEMRLTCEEVTP